jgi:hypothetical protein
MKFGRERARRGSRVFLSPPHHFYLTPLHRYLLGMMENPTDTSLVAQFYHVSYLKI